MDELMARYADLTRRLRAATAGSPVDGLAALAIDAEDVAASSTSTWMVTQCRALAAAARRLAGGPATLAPLVVDLDPPIEVREARARLAELLPGEGPLEARLEEERARLTVAPDALIDVTGALLRLLGGRAREDLDLPRDESVELRIAPRPPAPGEVAARADGRVSTLVLDGSRAWRVDELLDLVTRAAYPGRHAARVGRPAMPAWEPSPEASVLRGLELLGREVLLGDHELTTELDRIGRRTGARWSGARLLELRRALEDLVPSIVGRAAGAHGDGPAPVWLDALGATALERQPGTLRGAAWIARAAAPPLMREWLAVTGQTEGVRRLVREPLVPAQLRAEIADAG